MRISDDRQKQRDGRLNPYMDKPLPTRDLGKSASDFREKPLTNTKIVDGGNFNKLLIQENIKLKEEIKYLQGLIEDIFDEVNNLDELDNDTTNSSPNLDGFNELD